MLDGLFKGLLGPVIVLVAFGILGGVAVARADILNPNTSAAIARSIDTQNNFDEQRNQIELDKLEELAAMELEAERQRHAEEIEQMKHDAEMKRNLTELATVVLLGVGSASMVALTIAATYYLIRRAGMPQPIGRDSTRVPNGISTYVNSRTANGRKQLPVSNRAPSFR